MFPVEEVLESLDLSRAEPGIGFLEALFARFNARTPFETASKILRNAEIADWREKPRRPSVFWSDFLERGAGGTCFARVAAFDALLRNLGFSTRRVLGRVERDFDHAALLVSHGGSLWVCDVGFPLPALLPAQEQTTDTALAQLSLSSTARGFRVDFLSGVPEGPRTVEIFEEDVSEETFLEHWRTTLRPSSKFLSGVVLRRQDASRIVSYSQGEVRVDDLHSRLRVPLLSDRAERLAELFEIDRELLENAFSLSQEAPPQRRGSRLTAYLESVAGADTAYAAISRPETYRRLVEGIAVVVSEEETESGWQLSLQAPERAAGSRLGEELAEEVTPNAERLAIRVRRHSATSSFDSEFRVESRAGRTYLVREALFDSPREDLLRNDSLRGRLAGTLAVDLLAWARLLR